MFNGERSGEAALKSHGVAVKATDGCGESRFATVKGQPLAGLMVNDSLQKEIESE